MGMKIKKNYVWYVAQTLSEPLKMRKDTYVECWDYFALYGKKIERQEAEEIIKSWMDKHHRFLTRINYLFELDKTPLYGEIAEVPKKTNLYEVNGFWDKPNGGLGALYGYISAKNKKIVREMMIQLGVDPKGIGFISREGPYICIKI